MAASPLPSRGPKRGRKHHVAPTFSVIPNKGEQNQKWSPIKGNEIRSGYLTPTFSGPKGGRKCYVTPAFSRIPNKGGEIRSGRQQRGTKSEVAASPLPSRGPKRGRKHYVAPTFSGIPNKGEQNQKWSPTKGNKIRNGCLTPTFSGAQKRAEMLCHPCILGDPQQRGAKLEVVPNKGEQNQKWLPHPYLLGGPKEGGNTMSPPHSRESPTKGNKIRSGCLTPTFPGAQKRAEMLRHPCILGDPQQRGAKLEVVPNKGEQNQKWLPHPYLLGGPKEGANATSTMHSRGSPTKGSKIRSGPQQRGTKSEMATSPLPSRGPKGGRKCYVTPTFSGVPKHGFKKGPHRASGKKPLTGVLDGSG